MATNLVSNLLTNHIEIGPDWLLTYKDCFQANYLSQKEKVMFSFLSVCLFSLLAIFWKTDERIFMKCLRYIEHDTRNTQKILGMLL